MSMIPPAFVPCHVHFNPVKNVLSRDYSDGEYLFLPFSPHSYPSHAFFLSPFPFPSTFLHFRHHPLYFPSPCIPFSLLFFLLFTFLPLITSLPTFRYRINDIISPSLFLTLPSPLLFSPLSPCSTPPHLSQIVLSG